MQNNTKKGVLLGITSYIIWGFLPIYWKALEYIRSDIVLAQRVVWSFAFLLLFILLTKRWREFVKEGKRVLANKKTFLMTIVASLTIGMNWLVFIWAVHNEHVVQTSLGYYINPLVSVLLGMIFLGERLERIQQISFVLAAIGVAYLTISYQVFPWVSLVLAFSFATYGLMKKIAHLDSLFGLMIETIILLPIALGYIFYHFGPSFGFADSEWTTVLLLLGTGIATAIPLLLFGVAVLHIPLSLIGFLQYIAPTFILLIGVLLFNEPFTKNHFITFVLIWASLVLFMLPTMRQRQKQLSR